jgi:hypothetical protein
VLTAVLTTTDVEGACVFTHEFISLASHQGLP